MFLNKNKLFLMEISDDAYSNSRLLVIIILSRLYRVRRVAKLVLVADAGMIVGTTATNKITR